MEKNARRERDFAEWKSLEQLFHGALIPESAMIVGFNPVFDNPIRMGYVTGWQTIDDLLHRANDLRIAVGESRVVPATWEPFYTECQRCRYAAAYAWAEEQLRNPLTFALALAVFPGDEEQLSSRIGHANLLMMSTGGETSEVTRKLMLTEAFGLWETYGVEWLTKIVETCGSFGFSVSLEMLCERVQHALEPFPLAVLGGHGDAIMSDALMVAGKAHGFPKELIGLDGWTPDPGMIILPVDGKLHALSRHILRLDLSEIVLLKAGKPERVVSWKDVRSVHLWDGAVTFEIADQPPLSIHGYKTPEKVLASIEGCHKAATERILQTVAKSVLRVTP